MGWDGEQSGGQRRIRRFAFALALCAAGILLLACANGDYAVDGVGTGTGTEDEGGTVAPPDEDSGGGTVFLEAGLPGDDGGGAADSGPSADASAACNYPNMCTAAQDLGSVSGDQSGAPLTATGTTSDWIMAYVTENDNSAIGRKLQLKVTLDAPAGTTYQLTVYRNGNNSKTPECMNNSGQNTSPPSATLGMNWGEGTVANGSDDSETVTVRVDHVSGPCDGAHPWTVTITGNTQ